MEAYMKHSQMKKIVVSNVELTEHEMSVLLLLADGDTTKEIGTKLFVSPRTIDDYRHNLLRKVNARNTASLIAKAFRKKIIE
jgi:DNA-binding NarL/FixJ family response regulator